MQQKSLPPTPTPPLPVAGHASSSNHSHVPLYERRAFSAFMAFSAGALALCPDAPASAWYWLMGGVAVLLALVAAGALPPRIGAAARLPCGLSFLQGVFVASGAVRWDDAAGLWPFHALMLVAAVLYGLAHCAGMWHWPGALAAFIAGQFVVMAMTLGLGIAGAVATACFILGVHSLCAIAAFASLSRHGREQAELAHRHQRLLNDCKEQSLSLKEAIAVKSNFLAAASHDLRQPAQALALYVDELQRVSPPYGEGALVKRIKAASDNLLSALGALTDIAKLDGMGLEPRHEPVDLRTVLERICSTYQSAADAKGIRLSFANVDACVLGDPSVLHAILSNLVANAIKYTDEGSVRIHAVAHGTSLDVSIEDTGRGIPEKDRPRIYDEFFRGSNAGSSEAGMGLGLAIVRRLAHLAGIPIRLESAIGVGSRFVLTLPVALDAEAPWPLVRSRERSAPLRDDFLAGLQVVVLENDPVVALSLQDVLESWGAAVRSVHCADAMLQAIDPQGEAIDVLIVDHHLGTLQNGFDAVAALQRTQPEDAPIPVLMMTGDLDMQIERLAALHGFFLIHKPIPPSRLKSAMVALLHLDESFDDTDLTTTVPGTLETGAH